MLNASIRRKSLLFVLAAVLAMPWPAAGGLILENPRSGLALPGLDLLDRLQSYLVRAWTKVGCHIDPDGKAGCNIDPDGIPQPPISQTKEGCNIDPDGVPRCKP